MRIAFVLSTCVSVVGAIFFLACSDDDNKATGSDAGSSSSTSSSSGSSSGSTNLDCFHNPGPSPKRGRNGCILCPTEMKSGRVVQNVARTDVTGAADWDNVNGALAPDDNQVASVTITDGQESAELRITDFGFQVPPNADPWGVIVELKRRTESDAGNHQTADVDVLIGRHTMYKQDEADFFWPHVLCDGGYCTHAYGQEVDTWDAELVASDFAKASFGTKLIVRKSAGVGPLKGMVDSLRVQIWFADNADEKKCTK